MMAKVPVRAGATGSGRLIAGGLLFANPGDLSARVKSPGELMP